MVSMLRSGVAALLISALFIVIGSPALAEDVTISGQTKTVDAVDAYRSSGLLVKYTPAHGASTGTNAWGYEAAVIGGKVVAAEHLVGDMEIPADGYVLSAHGAARLWLKAVAPLGAAVAIDAPPPPPVPAADSVTIGSASTPLDDTDAYRAYNSLIRYTPASGATTGTNQWGYEAAVVDGEIVAVEHLVGNMAIPPNGYVLSGHGADRLWLKEHAVEGATVVLDGGSGPGDPPAPVTEERWLEAAPNCTEFYVEVTHQKRTNTWQWDGTQWVESWSGWGTHHVENRGATAADCPSLDDPLPASVALPDIQIKNLDKCGAGDLDLTGGDCFMIVPSAPFVADFPHLEGRKLLKFPVLTMNVGEGRLEIVADRSSHSSDDWVTYQHYYDTGGSRVATRQVENVDYYFAGDGHDHWHFTDFDDYRITELDGTPVGSAEKHGYCIFDNTSYTPFKGLPNVPGEAFYTYEETCAQGLPQAVSIIHGLSKGWGDTYPATLPDQALDITDVPDGRYLVSVTADDLGAVTEVSDGNNTASIEVTIQGDEVITHPETATGGLL